MKSLVVVRKKKLSVAPGTASVRNYRLAGDSDGSSRIVKLISKTDTEARFKTEHGVTIAPLDAKGEIVVFDDTAVIHEAAAGAWITDYFRELIEIRKTSDKNITGLFNGVLLPVYETDTLAELDERFISIQRDIRTGKTEGYKF